MSNSYLYNPITGEMTPIEDSENTQHRSIEELKNFRLNELSDAYKASLFTCFTSSASGEEVVYGYKDIDQLNYSKLANLFALNPNKTKTIIGTESHGVIVLTKEQFLVFMEDAEEYEIGEYMKRKNIELQIENAMTVEELEEIVISF